MVCFINDKFTQDVKNSLIASRHKGHVKIITTYGLNEILQPMSFATAIFWCFYLSDFLLWLWRVSSNSYTSSHFMPLFLWLWLFLSTAFLGVYEGKEGICINCHHPSPCSMSLWVYSQPSCNNAWDKFISHSTD